MNIIGIFLFLALIAGCSHGRFLGDWSITNDQPLIDECLTKALRHIRADQQNDITQSKVTNLVCKTQIINGIHIKLYFDLDQQKWECSFYKSPVQTLGIQYEQCTQIETPESSPSNDDDEAKIDELNQATRDKDNQQGSEVDNDDEEGLTNDDVNTPENNQPVTEPTSDTNDEDPDDEETLNEESDSDKTKVEDNNQQVPKQQNNDDENPEVPKETVNDDQVRQ